MDGAYAIELKKRLESEMKLNGKKTRVCAVDAAAITDMNHILRQMAASYIVLAIFSEDALKSMKYFEKKERKKANKNENQS